MTTISKVANTGVASAVKKSKPAKGGFAAPAADPSVAAGAPASTSAAMLDALIALQSANPDGGRRSDGRTIAAAQKVLASLGDLQQALLSADMKAGESAAAALHEAARLRAHAGADPRLLEIFDEIALRARVELAKLGR
ncbi:MAG: flagellar assembly protein FliX [Pseudomonadota bacterium]